MKAWASEGKTEPERKKTEGKKQEERNLGGRGGQTDVSKRHTQDEDPPRVAWLHIQGILTEDDKTAKSGRKKRKIHGELGEGNLGRKGPRRFISGMGVSLSIR